MNKPNEDAAAEAAPDSGTEPLRARPEDAAADDFESEDERRFFSDPPPADEERSLRSLEPVVAEAGDDANDGVVPSPEERAWLARAATRRATLQRWVGLAMMAGVVVLVAAGADRYLGAKDGTATAGASTVSHGVEPTPKKQTKTAVRADASRAHGVSSEIPAETARPFPVAVPTAMPRAQPFPDAASAVPSAVSAPSTAPAAPSAASVPSAASFLVAPAQRELLAAAANTAPPRVVQSAPAPNAAPVVAAGESDAAGLRERARSLLATGHSRDGVAFARAAVESDPLDARSYVLLGAGLQDLGDWAGARAVFKECTLKAKSGPNGACQYFARR